MLAIAPGSTHIVELGHLVRHLYGGQNHVLVRIGRLSVVSHTEAPFSCANCIVLFIVVCKVIINAEYVQVCLICVHVVVHVHIPTMIYFLFTIMLSSMRR